MSEKNQVLWRGIRPTNPEEDIPVKQSDSSLLKATVNDSWLAQGWVTEGISTTPAANEILADTGSLSAGNYDFNVHYSTTVDTFFEIQHRNAANTATLGYRHCRLIINNSYDAFLPNFKIASNERLRIIQGSAETDYVVADIYYTRRV